MKKYILDLKVTEATQLGSRYLLLKLTHPEPLPPMRAGQFAQLRIDREPHALLRRPISINYVDTERNEVWFLIQMVGAGTQALGCLRPDDLLNVVVPLGNWFTYPDGAEAFSPLLVGGGVGTAPMLLLGHELRSAGYTPNFLLGARSHRELMQLEAFEKLGNVYVTTEDGSRGERGFVTGHSILRSTHFTQIYTCGPRPMMMAVASYAHTRGIPCQASLENRMACGIGACLCCIEPTPEGNLCVCTEGPVFDINRLTWHN